MRILLIEDSKFLGQAIRDTLTRLGHAVTLVGDGMLAHAAFETDAFDLLIMDWVLPKFSGADLLARLQGRQVPILIISGLAEPESVMPSDCHFLRKQGLTIAELVRTVDSLAPAAPISL